MFKFQAMLRCSGGMDDGRDFLSVEIVGKDLRLNSISANSHFAGMLVP